MEQTRNIAIVSGYSKIGHHLNTLLVSRKEVYPLQGFTSQQEDDLDKTLESIAKKIIGGKQAKPIHILHWFSHGNPEVLYSPLGNINALTFSKFIYTLNPSVVIIWSYGSGILKANGLLKQSLLRKIKGNALLSEGTILTKVTQLKSANTTSAYLDMVAYHYQHQTKKEIRLVAPYFWVKDADISDYFRDNELMEQSFLERNTIDNVRRYTHPYLLVEENRSRKHACTIEQYGSSLLIRYYLSYEYSMSKNKMRVLS